MGRRRPSLHGQAGGKYITLPKIRARKENNTDFILTAASSRNSQAMGQEDIMSTAEDVADQVPNNGNALFWFVSPFAFSFFQSS